MLGSVCGSSSIIGSVVSYYTAQLGFKSCSRQKISSFNASGCSLLTKQW